MKAVEDDYFDPGLGLPLLNRYEFSAWSNERDTYPQFNFLNEDICKELNLVFSLKDLCYYRDGEKVVEVFQSTATKFYYMRQDIIEDILNKFNVHLDYEMYADKINNKTTGADGRYVKYREEITYDDLRQNNPNCR